MNSTPTRLLLCLKDLEQTEIFKAIGLSQGFEVHVIAYPSSGLRAYLQKNFTAKLNGAVLVLELDYLHLEGVGIGAYEGVSVMLSHSQHLVVRGAQVQWAKDIGALGLLPSLSVARLHEQIAEHLAPVFAIWSRHSGIAVNWVRAQQFASMVPSGLGRGGDLKNAHRLLAELNGSTFCLKNLALWARDQNGFDVSDRRWRLKTYARSFVGSQAIHALMQRMGCDHDKAVRIGEQMRLAGFFSHVAHDRCFEDGDFYYRFYMPTEAVRRIRLVNLLARLDAAGESLCRDRQFLGKTYERCLSGTEVVAWMQEHYKIDVDEAVQVGQYLLELGLLGHVVGEHQFKNAELFYVFKGLSQSLTNSTNTQNSLARLSMPGAKLATA